MPSRAHTLQLIRRRRALGLAQRRKRMPRQQEPTAIALEYGKALLGLVRDTYAGILRELAAIVPGVLDEAARSRVRVDASSRDLQKLFEDLADRFLGRLNTTQLAKIPQLFAERTSDYQREQLKKQITAQLGVDVFVAEPNLTRMLDAFVAENVAHIKTLSAKLFSDIETRVFAAVRAGARWEDLSADLQTRLGVAENRARVIARDQVGKLYSNLNEVRQRELGVDSYIWRTAADARSRPHHASREGKRFSWDDPPAGGHPGSEVLCRCYAEPDFSKFLAD